MERDDDKRGQEIKCTAAEFLALWATFEQSIPSHIRNLYKTNDMYARLYDTIFEELPEDTNESHQFERSFKGLIRLAKAAVKDKEARYFDRYYGRVMKLYELRNDLCHRLMSYVSFPIQEHHVLCWTRRDKNGDREVIAHTLSAIRRANDDLLDASFEIGGWHGQHIRRLLDESNLVLTEKGIEKRVQRESENGI